MEPKFKVGQPLIVLETDGRAYPVVVKKVVTAENPTYRFIYHMEGSVGQYPENMLVTSISYEKKGGREP